jgi:hypothetical protein
MAKQVNPSKSGKAAKPPLVTPRTTIKIPTTSWGGAMGYSDGGTIYWDSIFMHTILSVKLPRFEVGLPNQPITFIIKREGGSICQTIGCITDRNGYCSATAKDLPIDPNLNPYEDGSHWELYTVISKFEGAGVYLPSSWTQLVWISDLATLWKALGRIQKLVK